MVELVYEICGVFPRFRAVNVIRLPAAEILKFLVRCRRVKRGELHCNVRVIFVDEFVGQTSAVDIISC